MIEKINVYNENEIASSPKAVKILGKVKNIMTEVEMTNAIENEPFTVITTPGSHWFEGIVLIGYTGVKITGTTNDRDDDGNYVLLEFTTDQDSAENYSHKTVKVYDQTPSIDARDRSPRAFIGEKSYYLHGGNAGISQNQVYFPQSVTKPYSGSFNIENAILISIPEKINNKSLKNVHFGSSRLYATKISPVR